MSRNSLTKPSNCSRTQHEHRSRSFDPSGARAEDGQGSAAGNVGELEHHVAPEKSASPARSRTPPSRRNRTGQCPLRRSYLPWCNRASKRPNRAHRRRGPKVRILLAPAVSQTKTYLLSGVRPFAELRKEIRCESVSFPYTGAPS